MKTLPIITLLSVGALATAAFIPAAHAPKRPAKKMVTFAKDVAPILYSKCASCHHEGEVAPFSLMSYKDAQAKAKTIAEVAGQKFMPPWQAISHGQFKDERTLTPAQIETLKAWAEEDAPAGDLSKAPKPPMFTSKWRIGEPDFVAKPAKTYDVAAEGADEYRCFVLPTKFDADRYVTDVEFRPGSRKVVHHIVVFIDTSGQGLKKDGKDGKPGFASFGGPGVPSSDILAVWAPGLQPMSVPAGDGLRLPKGAALIMQVHYHRDGKPEQDQSEVAMKFASKPVDKQVHNDPFGNLLLSIQPGQNHSEAAADMYLSKPITILNVLPHMHLLGKDMLLTATLPDGSKQELVKVENYDFNWQTWYTYRKPVQLPRGTHLELVAHYDNTASNPHNPNNPPKPVWFGEQTTDEMCFAFFTYTLDDEHLLAGKKPQDQIQVPGKSETYERMFDQFDADHSGSLDLAEMTEFANAYQFGRGFMTTKFDAKMVANYLVGALGKKEKGKVSKTEFIGLLTDFSK